MARPNITIECQIRELQRELAMRNRLYPQWIEKGTLKKAAADYQIYCLEATVDELKKLIPPPAQGKLI